MTAELDYIAQTPLLLLSIGAILGLIVGSFLNVVAYRLPLMMMRDWRAQCAEFLQDPTLSAPVDEKEEKEAVFNLLYPPSRCPHCLHPITALQNIPVISFILQKGRCKHCHAAIAWRYPIVEISSAILSMMVLWYFGLTWATIGALCLTWALIALTLIDYDHQLLPDNITLPFLWLGLIFNLFGTYVSLTDAVLGAAGGYLILWLVYWGFRLATGKEGMGFGDFKLLAMLGAWMGWQMLPLIILFSSLVGAMVGISLILLRGHDRNKPIPFGPYLAAAGWLALIWGQDILHYYLWLNLPGE
jgi:leader peptidase (prepilin peptidase) / N-methyltransferase